jgi:hypothetical protein
LVVTRSFKKDFHWSDCSCAFLHPHLDQKNLKIHSVLSVLVYFVFPLPRISSKSHIRGFPVGGGESMAMVWWFWPGGSKGGGTNYNPNLQKIARYTNCWRPAGKFLALLKLRFLICTTLIAHIHYASNNELTTKERTIWSCFTSYDWFLRSDRETSLNNDPCLPPALNLSRRRSANHNNNYGSYGDVDVPDDWWQSVWDLIAWPFRALINVVRYHLTGEGS